MDLRVYYQKLRQIEAEIEEPFAVIVSRETSDGGRPGVKSDVPRALAAKLVADGKAELASAEIAAEFRSRIERRWRSGEGERDPVRVRSSTNSRTAERRGTVGETGEDAAAPCALKPKKA